MAWLDYSGLSHFLDKLKTIFPLSSTKGAANGIAELDSSGKVPSSQLPSYVDDVVEYATYNDLPLEGEAGKIYVTLDTNVTYRWTGSTYVQVGSSLTLGETSSTAYRGDRGADAYAHAVTNKGSAFTSGLYKITTNAEGHVTAATAITKSDITGYGIMPDFSVDALRSELLSISSVTHAKVYANYGDVAVNGIPARRLACVVRNGSKASIAQKIFDMNTSGLATHGSTSQEVASGDTVYFSRPTATYVSFAVTLSGNTAPDVSTAGATIQTAIINHMTALDIGVGLNVRDLCGYVYEAMGRSDFDVDIVASTASVSTRDVVGAAWDEKLSTPSDGVTVTSTAKATATTNANGLMSSSDKTTLNNVATTYVAISQGSGNAGKFLRVNSSGNLALETIANASGVSF